jgi:hypothetical protein
VDAWGQLRNLIHEPNNRKNKIYRNQYVTAVFSSTVALPDGWFQKMKYQILPG